MSKEWNVLLDARTLNSNDIIFNIMNRRGVNDTEEFLHPSIKNLISSDAFEYINEAADIVKDTIEKYGRFLIYGDVDLDGCTSTAILYRYLKHFTDEVTTYINVGKEHGIPNSFDVDSVLEGIDTVIVVDSINDDDTKYREILHKGINLIILDHHVPSQAILNIKKDICLVSSAVNYPNHALSGSGVTWKFVRHLDSIFGTQYSNLLVDLAASGIIGDICDVSVNSMENRYICHLGFSNVQNPAIKQIVGNYEFNSQTVSFSISPLINSANRTGNNQEALKLFISDDLREIIDTIDNLKSYREFQKQTIEKIYNEVIIPQAKNQTEQKCMYFLVEDAKNFAGVVASKVAEEFCRPVMVLTKSPDEKSYSGSMRSVGVENFLQIINASGNASCMGHEQSAGVTIEADKFFAVYNYIEDALKDYTFVQKIDVDARITPMQISSYFVKCVKDINRICGQGFKPVCVLVSDIADYTVQKMSQGKHLSIKKDGLSFIKWNFNAWEDVKSDAIFSAVGTLDESMFMGKKTQQLIINDYKFN